MTFRNLLLATVMIAVSAVALNAQPAQSKSAFRRGDAFVAQENYRSAIAEYSKVSTRDVASYARAIYNIGVCYYELWQTDEAIVFYRRALELKQGNYPKASYALGVALEDQGKLPEAKEAYQQAISSSRNEFALATYKLGVIEAKAGEFQRAADRFRDAASRRGQHVAASRNNLGVMLARLGFLKEAEREFVIALKQSNGAFDDAAHNLILCRSLLMTGLHDSQNFRLSGTDHIL
jgi:tetratricopeptide (TPR) repeat protein